MKKEYFAPCVKIVEIQIHNILAGSEQIEMGDDGSSNTSSRVKKHNSHFSNWEDEDDFEDDMSGNGVEF